MPSGRQRRAAVQGALLFVAALGCGQVEPPLPQVSDEAPEQAASAFDVQSACTLQGRVTWEGDLPAVAPFQARINISADGVSHERLVRENPNAPRIDADTRGVAAAVVFLRGVDPQRARPWDHAPVRIEQQDYRLHVYQGVAEANVGFVRPGDFVEMVSRQSAFHALHAGGATFFTLAFPDPDQPLSRRFKDKGLVELSSAAGYYWMRAYLFADDHPYYTRTDVQGRFLLPGVPPGHYDIVCWMPNWREERHERDPETGLVTRLVFAKPIELVQSVTASPGATGEVQFRLSTEIFGR
jgi:hypothetical protein